MNRVLLRVLAVALVALLAATGSLGAAQAADDGGAIDARYAALGGPSGPLGAPTGSAYDIGPGRAQDYEHGSIYWSEPTGAWDVQQPELSRYVELDGPLGVLGFPAAAAVQVPGVPGGRMQVFESGRTYASDGSGPWVLLGALLDKYLDRGGPGGVLGMPTRDPADTTGGRVAVFQRGRIYWSSTTGAHLLDGSVGRRFVQIGAGASYLGMPVSDTYRVNSGWKARFQRGSIVTSGGGTRVTGTWHPGLERVTAAQIPFTYRQGCPVGPSSLRRVKMPYYNWKGVPHWGKLIVRSSAADDMRRVFLRAFNARFSIRRMNPVDVYQGSDIQAMEADNTSAFNCRKVTGNPYRLSQHSYGNAIDINTRENPYVTSSRVYPSGSRTYLNRSNVRKGMIVRRGPIARGMRPRGWPWGARWAHPDYQHFSANGG